MDYSCYMYIHAKRGENLFGLFILFTHLIFVCKNLVYYDIVTPDEGVSIGFSIRLKGVSALG